MSIKEILSTPPNEKGIIEVEIDGKKRKFIKEKLLTYLENNGQIKRPKLKKVRPKKRKAVIVITPDNREIPFKSSADAARELNITRTNIPHVLSGRYSHVQGYRIKYAG